MIKAKTRKRIRIILVIGMALLACKTMIHLFSQKRELSFADAPKLVRLQDNGFYYDASTKAETVGELLKDQGISLGDRDQIIPGEDQKIYQGSLIEIRRAMHIKIEADGKKTEGYTLSRSIGEALSENGVKLSRLDKTSPDVSFPPYSNSTIVVTRINIEEIVVREDVDFKTITKTDAKMGWREKKIETPGEKGEKEVKYRVSYKNGQEVSRTVLSKTLIKDPVSQVETQGTFMKLGKADKGQGTWYSFQGGLYAASLTIAKGNYAKVTNTANGKSVVVQINDSGPYGKGRIIDLDKVAFQKIAGLGSGVINVKVEEVQN